MGIYALRMLRCLRRSLLQGRPLYSTEKEGEILRHPNGEPVAVLKTILSMRASHRIFREILVMTRRMAYQLNLKRSMQIPFGLRLQPTEPLRKDVHKDHREA